MTYWAEIKDVAERMGYSFEDDISPSKWQAIGAVALAMATMKLADRSSSSGGEKIADEIKLLRQRIERYERHR